jgi:hypothetical protein
LRLKHCLLLLSGTALAAPALAWEAQPESNGTVGPSEIRDFSLPGSRPAPQPAEPEPSITPVTPPREQPRQEPVAIPAPAAPATAQPAPAPAETARTPAPGPARPRTATPTEAEPTPQGEERLPEPADISEALTPEPAAPLPDSAPAAPADEPVEDPAATAPLPQATERPEEGSSWLFPLLGALAAIGAVIAFLRFRRLGQEEEESGPEPVVSAAPEPQPGPAPAPVAAAPRPAAAPPPPQPAPEPAPAAPAHIGIVLRPWLELEFRPARATATDGGASVQYEATIRNVGNAPARNVRLAARMFNAGPQLDAEVAHFFSLNVESPDGAPLTILPRSEVSLSSVVSMPREEMRDIKVQGRSLFIPTVAFNLLYEWGRGKTGQTCTSHVVGREPEKPSEKMAPFRLDLGPRTYRSVGQRPSTLARAV